MITSFGSGGIVLGRLTPGYRRRAKPASCVGGSMPLRRHTLLILWPRRERSQPVAKVDSPVVLPTVIVSAKRASIVIIGAGVDETKLKLRMKCEHFAQAGSARRCSRLPADQLHVTSSEARQPRVPALTRRCISKRLRFQETLRHRDLSWKTPFATMAEEETSRGPLFEDVKCVIIPSDDLTEDETRQVSVDIGHVRL